MPEPPYRDRSFPDRTFNREMEARVRVGGSITVADDEHVTGAVVAVAGSITVNGRVNQDVVAVGGNIHLGSKAEVRGDVVVVGGVVEREPGAKVLGKVSEVGVRDSGHPNPPELELLVVPLVRLRAVAGLPPVCQPRSHGALRAARDAHPAAGAQGGASASRPR